MTMRKIGGMLSLGAAEGRHAIGPFAMREWPPTELQIKWAGLSPFAGDQGKQLATDKTGKVLTTKAQRHEGEKEGKKEGSKEG